MSNPKLDEIKEKPSKVTIKDKASDINITKHKKTRSSLHYLPAQNKQDTSKPTAKLSKSVMKTRSISNIGLGKGLQSKIKFNRERTNNLINNNFSPVNSLRQTKGANEFYNLADIMSEAKRNINVATFNKIPSLTSLIAVMDNGMVFNLMPDGKNQAQSTAQKDASDLLLNIPFLKNNPNVENKEDLQSSEYFGKTTYQTQIRKDSRKSDYANLNNSQSSMTKSNIKNRGIKLRNVSKNVNLQSLQKRMNETNSDEVVRFAVDNT